MLRVTALAAAIWAISPAARADIMASPCTVEYFERYLGERCLVCEASEYEPERCRDEYAARGLAPRCTASPLGNTRGFSMWGELWCLPRDAPADAALPPALPPVERVEDASRMSAGLPKLPPDFSDPPPLAPRIDAPPAGPDPAAQQGPPAPAPAATPAAAPAPRGCAGCRVAAPDLPLALLVLLLIPRRRPPRP